MTGYQERRCRMKAGKLLILFVLLVSAGRMTAQTIPNNGMETWINHGHYDDPQNWDTPNRFVCILPYYTKVVTKSSDHQSGSFSARLESKTIPLFSVTAPGVITLGTLQVDIGSQTYSIIGGVPISDAPTHLKGYFKYSPKGGDSCAIGIVLTNWNGTGRDTLATGYFATKDTVASWTPFSAWIDYSIQAIPDTMNIIALSSATYTPTPGTVLFVDDLYLDYTTSVTQKEPEREIKVIQDGEQKELMVFFDFPGPEETSVRVFNILGQELVRHPSKSTEKETVNISCRDFMPGLYVLEILHENQKFTRKFIINP
jgi:hypothetical protein